MVQQRLQRAVFDCLIIGTAFMHEIPQDVTKLHYVEVFFNPLKHRSLNLRLLLVTAIDLWV